MYMYHFEMYNYTVEPLIKATPEMRPPLYKGHFTRSQMCILIQINP